MSALVLSSSLSFSFAFTSSGNFLHTANWTVTLLCSNSTTHYYVTKRSRNQFFPFTTLSQCLLDTPESLASNVVFVGVVYFFYSSVAEGQFPHPVHPSAHAGGQAQVGAGGSRGKAVCSEVIRAGQRYKTPWIKKRQQATLNHQLFARLGCKEDSEKRAGYCEHSSSPWLAQEGVRKAIFILMSFLVP